MTSDEKTLAFLARRLGALERRNEELERELNQVTTNQEFFKPLLEEIFKGIAKNGEDHSKILTHLGLG